MSLPLITKTMLESPKNKPNCYSENNLAEKNKQKLEFIEDVTKNTDVVQKKVLMEILTRNADVEYLRRYDVTDRETFKRNIPVIEYKDLQPDITRIVNGDKSHILCSQSHPISEFLFSSGTSSGGKTKLFPTTEEELSRRSFLRSLVMPVMDQFVPGLEKGKGMFFLFTRPEAKTPSGLVAQFSLTSFYKSNDFKDRLYDPYINYTSPNETILCTDSYQSMYSQMLLGLFQNEEVVRVGAIFALGFIQAIRFLEKHWAMLCHDIRTGSMDAQVTDPVVREAVGRILQPVPKLADFIERECSSRRECWKGIITRLWPNTKYVEAIVTGTMSQYLPTLDYYSNGLPLVSPIYAAAECFFGLNLNPLCKPSEVSYTPIPSMSYFEFLPVHKNNGLDDEKEQQQEEELVDLVDVKLGQEYELVVTTYAGLYRYRVGDVLRVAGFKNKAPQFNFIRRKNVLLSIHLDKTDEVELQNAVNNSVYNHLMPFDATLIEYTSYADITTVPGHYVLFWEVKVNGPTQIPPSVYQDCCLTLEESFNGIYTLCRVIHKSIGPLEIKIVESGTFDKLMDYAIMSLGTSLYKTPRCVKSVPILELLNSRVVSTYFSLKCPKWVPGYGAVGTEVEKEMHKIL